MSSKPKISELVNSLVVMKPTGKTESLEVTGDDGKTDVRMVTVVDIDVIDGRYGGQRFTDVYVFQVGLKAALEGYEPGTEVLGRIVKPGQAYLLEDPTEADRRTAEAVLA
jgi:hypothetical protein